MAAQCGTLNARPSAASSPRLPPWHPAAAASAEGGSTVAGRDDGGLGGVTTGALSPGRCATELGTAPAGRVGRGHRGQGERARVEGREVQGLGEAWGWGRRGRMCQESPCQAQTLPGLELGLIILLPGQQRRALPQRTRRGPRGRRGERGSRSRGNGGPRRGGVCGPGPSHGHWPGLLPLQSGDWRGVWSEPSGKEGRGGIEARGSRATCL